MQGVARLSVKLLYLEDLGEALEVGVGVRRFGGLFLRNGELWPAQLLAVEQDDGHFLVINGGIFGGSFG